jgi:DNA mismatch endonuclease (patch repair protein)
MDRSENMRSIRGKDTQPEMAVRSLVHRLGYRFRLHRADLPGKPDLAFPARRKVIFVHGCFWHSHNCKSGLIPHSNQEFWQVKLHRNKERDSRSIQTLAKQGWESLTIWQCELKNTSAVSTKIKRFLGATGTDDIAALADAEEGIRQGLKDANAGRLRPVREFFAEFEATHPVLQKTRIAKATRRLK